MTAVGEFWREVRGMWREGSTADRIALVIALPALTVARWLAEFFCPMD